MKTNLLLAAALFSASLVWACSSTTSGTGSCPDEPTTGTAKAKLTGGKCVGSARSCSSISVYSNEGLKLCAYQDGCTPEYDSKSCEGTAAPCSEQSEGWCKEHQQGCSWVEGDEPSSATTTSGGSSTGTAPGASATSANPCGSANTKTPAAATDGAAPAPSGTTTTTNPPSSPSNPTSPTNPNSGMDSGSGAPSGSSSSSGGVDAGSGGPSTPPPAPPPAP